MNKIIDRFRLIAKFQILTRILLARKKFYSSYGSREKNQMRMINLGGGLFFRPYWEVMDYISPYYAFGHKYIDYNIDLFGEPRFPFEDNSVDFLYSAHTLEHIPQEYCQNIMNEIYRTLKPGGAARLNMPDYDLLRDDEGANNALTIDKYVEQGFCLEEAVVDQIATAMSGSLTTEEVRGKSRSMSPSEFADYFTSRASREIQKESGGFHINWFNYDKLSGMLREAGFADISKSGPQGSRFAELRGRGGCLAVGNIFEIDRMLGFDTTHPRISLFVEAKK